MSSKKQYLYNFNVSEERKEYKALCKPLTNRNAILKNQKKKGSYSSYTEWENHMIEIYNQATGDKFDFEKYINLRLRQSKSNYDLSKAIMIPISVALLSVFWGIDTKLHPLVDDCNRIIITNYVYVFAAYLLIVAAIMFILLRNLLDQQSNIDFYEDILSIVSKQNNKTRTLSINDND